MWISENLADLPLGLELAKTGLSVHPIFSCTQPGLVEGTIHCESLIAPNRLPSASHKHHLIKAAPESLQIYLIHRNKYKEAVKMGRQETNYK